MRFFRKSAPAPQHEPAKHHRVLVVDRDRAVIDGLSAAEAGNLEFEFCETLGGLFEQSLEPYALLIVDLSLFNRNWASVITSIKQRPDAARLGLIATSESLSPDDIITALTAGADDYLLKPYSPAELIARVQAVIRRTK